MGVLSAFPSKNESAKADLTEAQMEALLVDYTKDASQLCNELSKANWAVQTDVNNQDKQAIQVRKIEQILILIWHYPCPSFWLD